MLIKEQLEQAQQRLDDVTRKSRFTAGQSSMNLSQRPSFNAFLAPGGLSTSKREEREDPSCTSRIDEHTSKVTKTRELPGHLQNHLADFIADQKRDVDQNKQQYLSPEER